MINRAVALSVGRVQQGEGVRQATTAHNEKAPDDAGALTSELVF
ncbi:hypothetical protein [Bradyrhizobium cosmicum]|nr:hypothetical protein [Bradyrhizobium cosmicum]